MSTALSSRVSQALSPLFRRDLFSNLKEEVDDLFGRFGVENSDTPAVVISPSLDVSETDESFQIRVDTPGMKADEINIEVSSNAIRISGEHKEDKEEKGRTYHRVERRTGSFFRSLTLPSAVNEDQVKAELKMEC